MATYAADTTVSASRSRDQLERTLERYGATLFAYMNEPGRAVVGFTSGERSIRFDITLPDPEATDFTLSPTGRRREPKAAREAYEQAIRQRWRALELVVKAKLEAVECGIATFEEEFLAYTILPQSGATVFESIGGQLAQAISSGTERPLLLEGPRA